MCKHLRRARSCLRLQGETGDVEMVEEHQLPKRETSASRRWPVARSVRGLRLPIQCFVLHDTDDRKSARYGNFFSVQWRFP